MTHITAAQRYTIFSMLQAGFTQTKIAQTIGKHKSTISREIAKNSDRRSGKYKCEQAQRKAEQRGHDKPHCRRLDEMLTYEKEGNKFNAIDGAHDDLLMTRAIGLHICLNEMAMPRVVPRVKSAVMRPRRIVNEASM